MEPNVSFFGRVILHGEKKAVVADYDDDTFETIHLTQVALGCKPTHGPHTVFVERDGEKFAIGTLDREKCPQFSIDFTLATDQVFLSHTGGSEVHVTGYRTSSVMAYSDDDGDDYEIMSGEEFSTEDEDGDYEESESEKDGSDGSESSEDDEEAPRALPLAMGNRQNGRVGSSSEEEESDEEGDAAAAPTLEELFENEREISKRKAAAQTPQPKKKSKIELPKAPATAPAKTGGDDGAPSSEAEFSAAVRAFLEKNGPTKLAVLGSNVKRPSSVPKSVKLKALVTSRPEFEYKDDDQTVSLA